MARKIADNRAEAQASPAAAPTGKAMEIALALLEVSPLNARTSTARAVDDEDDDEGEAAPLEEADSAEALRASILAEGVLSPLLVAGPGVDGRYEVLDGGRRLAALKSLWGAQSGTPVPCRVVAAAQDDDERKRSAALAANVVRTPLHPVDQFEAFAALAEGGLSAERIAVRYGLSTRAVRQRLALGALAPAVREAWRRGALDAGAAQAFTLEPDHAEQAKILKTLSKGRRRVDGWAARRAIVGKREEAGAALTLIGREDFEARGGRVVEDLFGDEPIVSDKALLDAMVAERIAAQCAALKAQGWGWADAADAHPGRWSYTREHKVRKSARGDFGCLVSLGTDGALRVETGFRSPKPVRRKTKTKDRKADVVAGDAADAPPALSASLLFDLSRQLTWAAQDALAGEPELALRLAVAALEVAPYDRGPVVFTARGLARPHDDGGEDVVFVAEARDNETTVASRLAARAGEPLAQIIGRFAASFAAALNLTRQGAQTGEVAPDEREILHLVAASRHFAPALARRFDAEDYFRRAGKAASIAALLEMGADDARALAKKKAPELAAMATAKARETGWLPATLRSALPPAARIGTAVEGPQSDARSSRKQGRG